VHVLAFSDAQGNVDPEVTDMLSAYRKQNSKVTYELVNLVKKPALATQYKVTQYNTIVFESGGKTNLISPDTLYTQGASQTTQNFNGEQKFTQAIISLISDVKHKVYLVTGHGELTSATASTFTSSLQQEGYDVTDLNLVKEAKIPADAETIIVLAPQKDLSDQETKIIQDYVKGKGKLMFSVGLTPDMDKWKNWYTILNSVGLTNQLSLAIEQNSQAGNPLTIVPDYSAHDITSKLQEQNLVTVLPEALGLKADANNKDFQSAPLLQTTAQSYGKTNLSRFTSQVPLTQTDVAQAAADIKGPLDLAYAIQDKDSKPKAIVIGNGLLFGNDLLNQYGNHDFVMNSLNWLQEQKNQITIRPREEAAAQQIMMTPSQARLVQYISLLVFPLLILLLGGGIWWRRRKG
jgi:hypothetical protein